MIGTIELFLKRCSLFHIEIDFFFLRNIVILNINYSS